MFDKSPGLKTSTCQYSVIVIAPPSGSSYFGTLKLLTTLYIPLNAYCSPFAVFLKPPDGGEPRCEGLFNTVCSFNGIYVYVLYHI